VLFKFGFDLKKNILYFFYYFLGFMQGNFWVFISEWQHWLPDGAKIGKYCQTSLFSKNFANIF